MMATKKDKKAEDAEVQGKNQGGAPDAPAKPPPTVASVLGEITWLMSMTPSHRFFFLSDLEWLVMPAVTKQQFRIYRDENGRPMGLVLWAKLDDDAEARIKSGASRIRPQDWDSGPHHWIIDLLDLSGGQRAQAIIDDMKANVFGDTPFKYHRVGPDGKREVVESPAA
jgi:cytolysin-activating lysine-acyltransferase